MTYWQYYDRNEDAVRKYGAITPWTWAAIAVISAWEWIMS